MSLSSAFARPLLIYDDKCYSCTKFAEMASMLSRGWIRTAGHYYSDAALKAKTMVFPKDYDPTNMFWLINKNGAYGARSALLPVAKEIFIGWFRASSNDDMYAAACEYRGTEMSCYTPTNVLKRFATLLSHGAVFRF